MNNTFKFALGQTVTIAVSGETGEVLGRAEYTTAANNYFVRYKTADGRATECWWQENALTEAPQA
jgi:hypothetical protein